MSSASLIRLLLLSAIWGGSFLLIRVGAPALGPVTLMEARVLLAAIFLAAVAMALLLTPVFDRGTEGYLASADNLDRMTTGSTPRRGPQVYTIRKSVLQASPDSVCVIRANGMRHGDC